MEAGHKISYREMAKVFGVNNTTTTNWFKGWTALRNQIDEHNKTAKNLLYWDDVLKGDE